MPKTSHSSGSASVRAVIESASDSVVELLAWASSAATMSSADVADEELVIGERVGGGRLLVHVDRHAGVLLVGERDRAIGLREDSLERRLRRDRIVDRDEDDRGRAAEDLRLGHGRVQRLVRELEQGQPDAAVEPWLDIADQLRSVPVAATISSSISVSWP